MRLQKFSISYEDVSDLALIEKVMEGGKNESNEGYKKKQYSRPPSYKNKDSSHTKSFNCNKHGHYAS